MSASADAISLINDDGESLSEARRRGRPVTTADRVYWIGCALLVLQLAWLIAFSTVLFTRDALTFDFSIFNQARWLIVHGHLDPFDTVVGYRYFDSHGELLMWPLAELTRLPPHGLLLLWAQDLAAVGCELVVLSWASVVLRASSWSSRAASVALGALAVLLVANPWSYVSVAFDFHFEVIGAFLALLAARDLWRGRPARAWVWAAVTWSAGDVCTLYIVGICLAALFTKGRRPWTVLMLLGTLVWFGVLTVLHADRGSGLVAGYGYLAGVRPDATASFGQIVAGVVEHPVRAFIHLWADRENLWANLDPSGLAGLASLWGIFPAAIGLLPGALASGRSFAVPSFQNFFAYPFLALGTVFTAHGLRRRPRLASGAPVLVSACALMAVAWAVVWLPRYPSTWLRVSPTAGQFLDQVGSQIPSGAEVVVSQGIAGRLSGRENVRLLISAPQHVAFEASTVYFVLSPAQGIEMPVAETDSVMYQVAGLPGVDFVAESAGVWVWRWHPPRGETNVTLGRAESSLPAWSFPGDAGTAVTSGPSADWHVAANGKPGYVIAHDYWFEPRGSYRATVTLAASSQVAVEVWDAATASLLARRVVPATLGRVHVAMDFQQARRASAPIFRGRGLLTIRPVPPPSGWPVEIRVFTGGGATVSVYTASVQER